ncbi:MAG: pyridoxal phosphate-dependent decarboxylase family protein [Planctomycetota bacterium]
MTNSLRDDILALELAGRALEPAREERKRVRDRVVEYTEAFLNEIDSSPAFRERADMAAGLLDYRIGEYGIPIERLLSIIKSHVDDIGLNPASGGHLGYIPGGGIYYSALGDYLADITNRFAGLFYTGPGAVRVENQLIRWMSEMIGFPQSAFGNLTSGGSVANLIAIVTAREAMGLRPRDIENAVIYFTDQIHYSIDKALRVAGLNHCVCRTVPRDECYRMDAAALERMIQIDVANGLRPFLLIASAGTTDAGAVDPLEKLAVISKKYGAWFHVDAAYGGFFVLTKEGKEKLRGIERADSVVVDPHKGLFVPYGLGTVLVREGQYLYKALHSGAYHASYMQDADDVNEEPSPCQLSPELTKHFRGMRLWLPLQMLGVAPFRACLEEKLLLTRYFYNEVRKLGFETPTGPELSVATYRYIPKSGGADEFNKRLRDSIVADGRVFISSTTLDGKYTLRLACLAFRTHLPEIDCLLSQLRNFVEMNDR